MWDVPFLYPYVLVVIALTHVGWGREAPAAVKEFFEGTCQRAPASTAACPDKLTCPGPALQGFPKKATWLGPCVLTREHDEITPRQAPGVGSLIRRGQIPCPCASTHQVDRPMTASCWCKKAFAIGAMRKSLMIHLIRSRLH